MRAYALYVSSDVHRRQTIKSNYCNKRKGLYHKLHGTHRPINMKRTVIKRRKRAGAKDALAAAAATTAAKNRPPSPSAGTDSGGEGSMTHRPSKPLTAQQIQLQQLQQQHQQLHQHLQRPPSFGPAQVLIHSTHAPLVGLGPNSNAPTMFPSPPLPPPSGPPSAANESHISSVSPERVPDLSDRPDRDREAAMVLMEVGGGARRAPLSLSTSHHTLDGVGPGSEGQFSHSTPHPRAGMYPAVAHSAGGVRSYPGTGPCRYLEDEPASPLGAGPGAGTETDRLPYAQGYAVGHPESSTGGSEQTSNTSTPTPTPIGMDGMEYEYERASKRPCPANDVNISAPPGAAMNADTSLASRIRGRPGIRDSTIRSTSQPAAQMRYRRLGDSSPVLGRSGAGLLNGTTGDGSTPDARSPEMSTLGGPPTSASASYWAHPSVQAQPASAVAGQMYHPAGHNFLSHTAYPHAPIHPTPPLHTQHGAHLPNARDDIKPDPYAPPGGLQTLPEAPSSRTGSAGTSSSVSMTAPLGAALEPNQPQAGFSTNLPPPGASLSEWITALKSACSQLQSEKSRMDELLMQYGTLLHDARTALPYRKSAEGVDAMKTEGATTTGESNPGLSGVGATPPGTISHSSHHHAALATGRRAYSQVPASSSVRTLPPISSTLDRLDGQFPQMREGRRVASPRAQFHPGHPGIFPPFMPGGVYGYSSPTHPLHHPATTGGKSPVTQTLPYPVGSAASPLWSGSSGPGPHGMVPSITNGEPLAQATTHSIPYAHPNAPPYPYSRSRSRDDVLYEIRSRSQSQGGESRGVSQGRSQSHGRPGPSLPSSMSRSRSETRTHLRTGSGAGSGMGSGPAPWRSEDTVMQDVDGEMDPAEMLRGRGRSRAILPPSTSLVTGSQSSAHTQQQQQGPPGPPTAAAQSVKPLASLPPMRSEPRSPEEIMHTAS